MGAEKPRVLVVDDERDALESLCMLLRSEGFECAEAASGTAALAWISKRQPDLIIVDLMMPAMNGLEFCEESRGRAATRDIPIILYSGAEAPRSRAGLYDLALLKPAEVAVMVRAIRSLIRNACGAIPATG